MSQSPDPPMRVSHTPPASPGQFSVDVTLPGELPLDEVVCTSRKVAHYGRVTFYGVVSGVQISGSEGAYQANVRVTRIEPEINVPPLPGELVTRANAAEQTIGLHFDGMHHKWPLGYLSDAQTAWGNRDFVSGEKGGHVNIAGISGVATKTSYALFLLYSLFHGEQPRPARAIVFNVKGDDLLYLDKPNSKITPVAKDHYKRLGLPCTPFPDVAYHGVQGGLWTLKEFAERQLLRFLFNEPDQSDTVIFAVDQLAEVLKKEAEKNPDPVLHINGQPITDLSQLTELLCEAADDPKSLWFDKAAAGTRQAVVRRLRALTPQVTGLLRDGTNGQSFHYQQQLNVVDLHRLSDKARAFVIGAVLQNLFQNVETQAEDHPTVYLVLDELNKYAPREGNAPIKQMLLDVAERGRSLGLILIGAQQTASAVEERIVSNCSFRVVGRLESGEASKETYGWLTPALRERACQLQPGSMFVSQPQVPVPLSLRFPYPAWATRRNEAT